MGVAEGRGEEALADPLAWEERGDEGMVESAPEVVKGVRSRISGKRTAQVFLEAFP